jgi:hypothetical protein
MSSNETAEAILIVIKRLAWWVFLLVVGIVALIAGIAGVYWSLDEWSRRAVEVKTLEGITLGDKIDDVLFRIGKFVDYHALANQYGGTTITPPGSLSGASHGLYENFEKRTAFRLKNGRVNTVFYFCRSSNDYTKVNDQQCGSYGDDILKRFGPDIRILCHKDNAKDEAHNRAYDTTKYGVRYLLRQNQVVGFTIAEKHELQGMLGENWVQCP